MVSTQKDVGTNVSQLPHETRPLAVHISLVMYMHTLPSRRLNGCFRAYTVLASAVLTTSLSSDIVYTRAASPMPSVAQQIGVITLAVDMSSSHVHNHTF